MPRYPRTKPAPALTDDTLVYADVADGEEPTAFRNLMVQDRKCVEWDAVRGVYVCAYPF